MALKVMKMGNCWRFLILVFGFCIGLNLPALYNYFACTNHVYDTTENILLFFGLVEDVNVCPTIWETSKEIAVNVSVFGLVPAALALILKHLKDLLQGKARRKTTKSNDKPLWIDGFIKVDRLESKAVTVAHLEFLHCGMLDVKIVYCCRSKDVWTIPIEYEDVVYE